MEHFRMEMDDGTEFETSPDNTELYRYVGRLAVMNHVYLEIDEDTAVYVFSQSPAYPYLEELATMNQYPIHDNLRAATDPEMSAFGEYIDSLVEDIPNEIPRGWLGSD